MLKQLRARGKAAKEKAVNVGLKAMTAAVTPGGAEGGAGGQGAPPPAAQVLERESEAHNGAYSLVLQPANASFAALEAVATVALAAGQGGEAPQLDASVTFRPTQCRPGDKLLCAVHACLGVVKLRDEGSGSGSGQPAPFLVVVTAMRRVASLHGVAVYKVEDTQLIPLLIGGAAGRAASSERLRSEVLSVRLFLNTGGLHIAPPLDLSRPLSALLAEGGGSAAASEPWRLAWESFWFNYSMSASLRACECAHPWIVVAVQGYAGETSLSAPALPSPAADGGAAAEAPAELTLTLIARRHWRRAGTRYHHRGIDDSGNTANHVESEQILTLRRRGAKPYPHSGGVSATSFLQCRGSAPVHFMQRHAVHKVRAATPRVLFA
jgi:hypothetical protein